jgi:hypothetical protein
MPALTDILKYLTRTATRTGWGRVNSPANSERSSARGGSGGGGCCTVVAGEMCLAGADEGGVVGEVSF